MASPAGHRLKLRPGLTVLPEGDGGSDGLLVSLNSRVLRLRGRSVRRVLDLLDGTRTLEDLCRAMHPTPLEQVAAVVEKFRRHGLLEPELDYGPHGAPPPALLRALYDLGVDARAVSGELAAGTAGVVGGGALAEATAEALARCGVGTVLRVRSECLTPEESMDVAVAAPEALAPERLEQFNVAALRCRLPWILLEAGGFGVRAGPFILPGETACFACYQLRCAANRIEDAAERVAVLQAAREGAVPMAPADDLPPGVALLAAELATLEVVRFFVGRVSSVGPALYGRVAEYALLSHQAVVSRVLRLPRCPVCGPRASGHPPVRAWMEPYDYRDPV